MRRRLFNFAAGVSLWLCVAACIFWTRPNYWFSGIYTTSTNGNSLCHYGIATTNSRLQIWQLDGVAGWRAGLEWTYYPYDASQFWISFDNSNDRWRFIGIAHYAQHSSDGTGESVFIVHLAWIAVMAAVLPAAWCIQKKRALRHRGHRGNADLAVMTSPATPAASARNAAGGEGTTRGGVDSHGTSHRV